MNSVVQQLYMIPDLRCGVLTSDVNSGKLIMYNLVDDKHNSSLFQLQLIFANLQETEKKYYTPRDFTKTISIEGRPVDVRRQQDAQEFFNILSENIEDEVKGTTNEKLLKEILGGEICNEIKSLEEGHEYVSHSYEPFYTLQLDIKNRKSIEEALDYYIKPDILEGDNKYYCEKYDKKIKVHKRAFLKKTSNTLVINLKRFEFDYNTFRKYKVNDYCEFPMEFSIKPWTKEGIQERENVNLNQKEKSDQDLDEELPEVDTSEIKKKVVEEEKKEFEEDNEQVKEVQPLVQDDKSYIYEVAGVVVHSGGAEGGHYYSFIKDRENNKWFEFNDTNVRPFDVKDLPDETFGGEGKGGNFIGNATDFMGDAVFTKSKNAYFIIYQKKHPEAYETIQLIDPIHEYVKGIPKNVYQHIWDENMLFMKRMYFFDSEYLHFIREFLNLKNFERQLYTSSSSLTKKMITKKGAAEILEVTQASLQVQAPVDGIDMFDVTKEDMEMIDKNENINTINEFNPQKDIGNDKNVGESVLGEENILSDKIVVDTSNISEDKIKQAKDLLSLSHNQIDRDEYMKKLEEGIMENPALYVIKFSTMFALKIKDNAKDSFSFISLLQQLNSMYEMHADG